MLRQSESRLSVGVRLTTKDLPQGSAKVAAVRAMFDEIAYRYEIVNGLLTFGLDRHWRRRALARLALPPGSLVVDLACGTGDFCRLLSAAGQKPVGFDLSFGMLSAARTVAPLVQTDAQRLPLADGSVDGATCGFGLRNLADLALFFMELTRVVRPGGRVALLDAGEPQSPVLRFGHGIYFRRVVPQLGGWLSGNAEAYAYLPRSLAYLPPAEQMIAGLQATGFRAVQHTTYTAGAAQLITATRTDAT